mgnify:CR=1 FL=1
MEILRARREHHQLRDRDRELPARGQVARSHVQMGRVRGTAVEAVFVLAEA